MNCHLFIPSLFSPALTHAYNECPALKMLLARGNKVFSLGEANEMALCRLFGLQESQESSLPLAALNLLGEGKDPNDYHWLRADPVHLAVDRDQLLLLDSHAFPLKVEEAQSFIQALNSHFADLGVFSCLDSACWYLQLTSPALIYTTPISAVVNRSVFSSMPKGSEAKKWRQIMNEIQMVLHEHPINIEREKARKPVINSLWFWGNGMLPKLSTSFFHSTSSNDSLALGLAKASNTPFRSLPTSAITWLRELHKEQSHLAVLPNLQTPIQYNEQLSFLEALQLLEKNWFVPLRDALKNSLIDQLTIIAPGEEKTLQVNIKRGDLWKFWRRIF